MKKIASKLYLRFGKFFGLIEQSSNSQSQILYKIGNVKNRNTNVDGLIPQAVKIGDNFISSVNTYIVAHDASLYNHIRKHRIEKVEIGDNVFLGLGSIVLPGVKIGNGAIIGAGAVVTKDVDSYTVVAGNPAKFMCTVDEYIKKCEERGVLFDTPISFEKYYKNSLSKVEVDEFQKKYVSDNE
ncbi:MAG TPA: acetyltransferase [Chryseobacterium sp.]|nr:acetyltransferase [Chryseobacterium sp.]